MQTVPGARLTYQDREQISAWLDDGLGYAEIARRLGRPTSTISREVARNHDSGNYRAGPAQQAATRRAPRRRAAAVARPDSFAEEFAVLLARTGLPKMCARVFACLVISESGSLTAADLARTLSVSPASVSKSVGYLEEMDLLSRTPDAGTRRERYVIGDDVWQRAWQTDTGAHAAVAEAARRGAALLGPDSPAGARLRKMDEFFGWLAAQMTGTSGPPTTHGSHTTGPDDQPTTDGSHTTAGSNRPTTHGGRTTGTGGGPATHDAPPTADSPPSNQPAAASRQPMRADHAAGTDDPLTVLAALVYAGRPLTAGELAAALGWPPGRVAACLGTGRLTPAQRAALRPKHAESGFTSGLADAG